MSPRLEPNQILQGDSREVLKTLPDASIDSVVTDPPAGIAFMAKEWDDPDAWKDPSSAIDSSSKTPNNRLGDRDSFIAFMQEVMRECYRVLKPGGHMFVWAIPRTSHWTATA